MSPEIVPVSGQTPEAVMDADHLEWLLGQTVEQGYNGRCIDMTNVIHIQMIEDTSTEETAFLVMVPERDNQIVVLGTCRIIPD